MGRIRARQAGAAEATIATIQTWRMVKVRLLIVEDTKALVVIVNPLVPPASLTVSSFFFLIFTLIVFFWGFQLTYSD